MNSQDFFRLNSPKWQQVALLALLLAYGSLYLNAKAFWGNHPESRRAQIASEFLTPGHSLLVPTMLGTPILTKPPLFYWMQAACMKVLGKNEAAARLPSVVLGFLCLLAVYANGCRWRNETTGWYAVGILIASPMFLDYFRVAELDMGLCSAVAVTVYCVHRAVFEEQYQPAWAGLTWVALTIGFLLKGPYALFPLIPLGVWLFAEDSRRFRRLLLNPGIAIFLLLVGGYYLYILQTVPGAATILHGETLGRFGGHAVHQRPFYYYLQHILMFGVWVPFIFPAMRQAWRSQDRYARYLFLLSLGVFVLLSIIKSKKGQYLLPVFPLWALLVAVWLDRLTEGPSSGSQRLRQNLGRYLVLVSRVLMVAVWCGTGVVFYLGRSSATELVVASALCLGATALLVFAIRRAKLKDWGLLLQAGGWLLITLLVNGVALPALNSQHTIRQFARQISGTVPEEAVLYGFQIENYSLPFYSGKKTVWVDEAPPREARYVVTRVDKLEALLQYGACEQMLTSAELFPGEALRKKYNYLLCRFTALSEPLNQLEIKE
jgi:4-amino-4-deoxy-L-arabinose transferase-like glycosyltransferase